MMLLCRSVWKKKFFNREKTREIAFRQKLIDKVRAAEKFNAEVSALCLVCIPGDPRAKFPGDNVALVGCVN